MRKRSKSLAGAVTLIVPLVLAACSSGATSTAAGSQASSAAPASSVAAPAGSGAATPGSVSSQVSNNPIPQSTAAQAAVSSPANATSQEQAVETFSMDILNRAITVWGNWFAANAQAGLNNNWNVGWEFIRAGDQPYTSNCTDSNDQKLVIDSNFNNMFFCSADTTTGANGTVYQGVIILPDETLIRLWSGDIIGRPVNYAGDFTAATILTHEFGHKVQALLQQQLNLQPIQVEKNRELIADCFAGTYAISVWKDGLLTDADVTQAVTALQALGSYDYNSPTFHGTPDERGTAWRLGYFGPAGSGDYGNPANCIDTYWH
jgi:predicted metalloprotease